MQKKDNEISISTYRSGLFWRTFILVGVLLIISMAAWIGSYHVEQRGPRAKAISKQIASVATVTRAALVHSNPDYREELLRFLDSQEGIRIYPLDETDVIQSIEESDSFVKDLLPYVRETMGEDTILSSEVNGHKGLWMSFKIDEDDIYWIRFDNSRLRGPSGIRWMWWAAVVLLLSLIGAAFISRLLNEPLSRLANASRELALGKTPAPLPETGVLEIKQANRSFNQMVADLKQIEETRAEILAGISHDLRTPLTRMRLELEMSSLSEDSRQGMQSDINQMESIVGQFMDYARLEAAPVLEHVNLSELVSSTADEFTRHPQCDINKQIDPELFVYASAIDLKRLLNNVLTNAIRYGKTPETERTRVDIVCRKQNNNIVLTLTDYGVGIPEESIDNMLLPFTRLNAARSQANGAGLGLAIVSRIAAKNGIALSLKNQEGAGLSVQLVFKVINN